MVRHPSARRIPRETKHDDDVFVEGVLESTVWAKQHGRSLVIAGVVLVVAILAFLYWRNISEAREERAATELVEIRQAMMSGNAPLVVTDARQFLENYGGTTSADEVRLILGQALLQTGAPQEAVEAVQPAARDVDEDMGVTAAFLLGAAYEAANQPDAAEAAYLGVADDARFLFQQQEALDQAARVRAGRGDTEGAIELYQRLLDITPEENRERSIYAMRLAELQAGMGAGAGTAEPAPTTGG